MWLNALLLGLALGLWTRIGGLPGLLLFAAAAGIVAYRVLHRRADVRAEDLTPRNERELWIFGTYANWAQYNAQLGERDPDGSFPIVRPDTTSSPFYLGGRPFPDRKGGDRRYYLDMLDSPWDIHSKKDLLDTVEYMSTGPGFQRCADQDGRAWELCRCNQLLSIAFRLGWLSRSEMVRRSCAVGKIMQNTFSGWEEMSQCFLNSCLAWMGSDSGARLRLDIHEHLWERRDSPYRLPWNLKLD